MFLIIVYITEHPGILQCFQNSLKDSINLESRILKESSNLESTTDVIVLKDKEGHVILNKSIKALWEQPLRIWDYKNEMLTHIHVKKTSGAAFDFSLRSSQNKDGCRIKCLFNSSVSEIVIETLGNRTCPSFLNTFYKNHFDWTQVEALEEYGVKTAPVFILRHPAYRTVSHFHQMKKKHPPSQIIEKNFTEYMNDAETMSVTQNFWLDGQVIFQKILVDQSVANSCRLFGDSAHGF